MQSKPHQPKPPSRRPSGRRVVINSQNGGHRRHRRPIRNEISAGGVVVRQENGKWMVALLKTEHKRGEVWVLPKGHVEPHKGETVSAAALREVSEEAGITSLSLKSQLGVTKFSFQAENALVKKKVHYFLMATNQIKLTPQAEEGLIDATWAPIDKAIELLAYDTDQDIVSRAREKLTGTPRRLDRRPGHGSKPRRIHT